MRFKKDDVSKISRTRGFKNGQYLNGTKSIEVIAMIYLAVVFILVLFNLSSALSVLILVLVGSQLFTLSLANITIMFISSRDRIRLGDIYTFIGTSFILCVTLNLVYYITPAPKNQPEVAHSVAYLAFYHTIITVTFFSIKNFFIPKDFSNEQIYIRLSVFLRPFYLPENADKNKPMNSYETTKKKLLCAWFICMGIILSIGSAFTYTILNY